MIPDKREVMGYFLVFCICCVAFILIGVMVEITVPYENGGTMSVERHCPHCKSFLSLWTTSLPAEEIFKGYEDAYWKCATVYRCQDCKKFFREDYILCPVVVDPLEEEKTNGPS